MSIQILETVKQANATKEPPSSRHQPRTLAVLYRKCGVRFLLNGIGSPYAYWGMNCSVVKLLLSFLLPSPVAYIIASVLLAETHFFWTARTILPRDQVRLAKARDRKRWKVLVISALIYAAMNTLMTYVPALFDDNLAPPEDVSIEGLSYVVGTDILIAGFMLFAQLFFLISSYIALDLVQASLLPPKWETLVFTSRQKQRVRRVGEIFSVKGGPLQAQEAVRMVSVARLLCVCNCMERCVYVWLGFPL